jgi:copper chaperone CopZ
MSSEGLDARVYTVTGMTCGHCVEAVRGEVARVPGVGDVEVDLATGRVRVSGSGFTDQLIADAVVEAGYALDRR